MRRWHASRQATAQGTSLDCLASAYHEIGHDGGRDAVKQIDNSLPYNDRHRSPACRGSGFFRSGCDCCCCTWNDGAHEGDGSMGHGLVVRFGVGIGDDGIESRWRRC